MDPRSRNVAQRAIDHPLAHYPVDAGKGGTFHLDGKMALPRTVIAAMAMMAGAIVDDGYHRAGKSGGKQRLHFGLYRSFAGHVTVPFLVIRHFDIFAAPGPTYMASMRIEMVRGKSADHIRIARADGSVAETRFAHKGPFPHDAVHFVVEQRLGFDRGFWGLVAEGRHPEELAELAKAAGHASAKRAQQPAPHIVALIQAERIVELFEADMWSGAAQPPDMLRATMDVACAASLVPAPDMDDAMIAAIRGDLSALAAQWGSGRLTLNWGASA